LCWISVYGYYQVTRKLSVSFVTFRALYLHCRSHIQKVQPSYSNIQLRFHIVYWHTVLSLRLSLVKSRILIRASQNLHLVCNIYWRVFAKFLEIPENLTWISDALIVELQQEFSILSNIRILLVTTISSNSLEFEIKTIVLNF
jgi:hypothetical protein